jgi:hypothetical protein
MGLFAKMKGSKPAGFRNIEYYDDYPLHTYQNMVAWTWPNVPAHEQRSALINAWTGNQMPGYTNFVPGVMQSNFTWNVPTSYANTLKNQQYNQGYNIQSQSAFSSSQLTILAQQAWMNRYTGG